MPQITSDELFEKAKTGNVRAQVRLGLLLEADGKPDAGLDWLARAAQTNDAEALTLVGLRLISGRYERTLAKRGVGLLIEAVAAGSAEAAERLAVLSALGLYLRQDWSQSLDYLQKAAELGSGNAGQQILALAGATEMEIEEAENPSQSWERTRRRIDLGALHEAGPPRLLNDNPQICAIDGFASPAVCDCIIRQAAPRLRPAEVYNPSGTGQFVRSPLRNNSVANYGILETTLVNLVLQAKIARAAGVPFSHLEGASVLRYLPGEQATEHFDFLDTNVASQAREIAVAGQRIATALVYLNDAYSVGTTDFPQLGLSFKARRGDALLFRNVTASMQPEARSEHAGRPPAHGTKWVFSNFIRNRPTIALDAGPANAL